MSSDGSEEDDKVDEVEKLFPDPSYRRTIVRQVAAAAVVLWLITVACIYGSVVTGDSAGIGFAILFIVPAVVTSFTVLKRLRDL